MRDGLCTRHSLMSPGLDLRATHNYRVQDQNHHNLRPVLGLYPPLIRVMTLPETAHQMMCSSDVQ